MTDQIGHVGIWARLARVALRVASSLVEGLIVAGAVALVLGVSIGTLGCGGLILCGLAAGFLGSITGWSDYKEKKIKEMTEDIGDLDITGALGIKGAATVLINHLPAMRATLDAAVCSKHYSLNPNLIAEGTDSVFVETGPAARKGDKLMCSAQIASGSDDVKIGGNKTQYLEIADDKDWWETGLELAIGLAMGRGGFGSRLGCLGLGMVAGMAGDALGKGFRWLVGYPVHPATGGKVLDGGIDTEFALPGVLPIAWRRFYSSHDHRLDTLHGKGWSTPWEVELHVVIPPQGSGSEDAGRVVFIDKQGRHVPMPLLQPGHALFNTAEGYTLNRTHGGAFEIVDLDQVQYQFGCDPQGTPPGTNPSFTLGPGTHVLKVQRIRDRFKNWVRLRYDDHQRLHRITDHLGRVLNLAYPADVPPGSPQGRRVGTIALLQGAPGESTGVLASYQYDAQGQLTQVVDLSGHTTRRFAYTGGLMTMQADAAGFECGYEWEDPAHASGPESEGLEATSPHRTPTGRDRRVVRHWTHDGESYDIAYRTDPGDAGGETQATDQLGRRDHWTWDGRYNLTAYRNTLGHTWRLAWSGQRELLSCETPEGRTTQFQYDDNGMRTSEVNALGEQTRTVWDGNWFEPLAVSLPGGRVWRFEYDLRGVLVKETAPDGSTTRYASDERGLPLEITDAKGGKKRLAHDARGLLTAYTDCSGKTTRYAYDGWGHLSSVTDALGQVTHMAHGARGELLTMVLPDGSRQTNTYDDAGRPATHTDGLMRASHYRYSARGQLQWRVDAAQRQISARYDDAHRLASLATENGVSYGFSYDDADRMVEERRLDGTRVALEYDSDGHVVAVIHHPTEGDDVFHELETQALEGTLSDGPRHKQNQLSRRTELVRDSLGRLVEKRTHRQVLRYAYSLGGDLQSAQRFERLPAPQGAAADASATRLLHTTRFEYDVAGNLVAEHATDETTARTHTLRHEHDALGNRTRTELPLLSGGQFGGADGRSPPVLRRSLNHLYYGSGHLHQVNLGLQLLNRTGLSPDDEWTAALPEAHRLIADLERDDLHREVQRTQGSLATHFVLDPMGRRLGSWTQSGLSLSIGDRAGQAAWQDEWKQRAANLGQGGGLLKAYQYDAVGELRQSRHSHKGGSRYDYDAGGRINQTQRHSLAGQAQNEHFAYDPAGNLMDALTAAAQPAPSGQARSQGYIRDNLVRVYEDKRYAYDGFGRLIQKRVGRHTLQRFDWDDQDQLVEVATTRQPGTPEATTQHTRFTYDALGRRVGKHDAFGLTEFIWEGMRLIEERRGARVVSYVYEPGGYVPLARIDALGDPVAEGSGGVPEHQSRQQRRVSSSSYLPAANDESGIDSDAKKPPTLSDPWGLGGASANERLATSAQVYYFHNDPSGLPEELSDGQGQVRWRAAYRTWGSTQVESWDVVHADGSEVHPSQINPISEGHAQRIEQNLRFQGQYLDRDSGLHYNTFRYYDPDIGRFISPDPIGLDGGLTNLHAYAPNPLKWIDPWGWALEYVDFSGQKVFYPVAKGQYNEVVIRMQGGRGRDFTLANKAAGIKGGTPAGYTWHHVDFDPRTGRARMQLVLTSAHEASFPHRGSVADFEKKFGVKYETQAARDVVAKKGWRGKC